MELHNITDAAEFQRVGHHPHSADCQQISTLFPQGIVMAAGVVQAAFGGAQIFLPLLLQMNQCPLAAAETKVLNA